MRIIAGVLCDYAEVREGLLTIVSAGITRLWRAELPAPMGVFLALQVEVEANERPFPHELEVAITGPSGKATGKVTGGSRSVPEGTSRPMSAPLSTYRSTCEWSTLRRSGGTCLRSRSMAARPTP